MKILYPFSVYSDSYIGYNFSIKMALNYNAELIFFTTDKENKVNETDDYQKIKDRVYLHLLNQKGLYETKYNKWDSNNFPITRYILEQGNMDIATIQIIKSLKPDAIIYHKDSPQLIRLKRIKALISSICDIIYIMPTIYNKEDSMYCIIEKKEINSIFEKIA